MFDKKSIARNVVLFFTLIFLVLFIVLYTHFLNLKNKRFEFEAMTRCVPGYLYAYDVDTGRAICFTNGRYKMIEVEIETTND